MFTSLTLENFKCFSSAYTFDLSKINIFTGYNGRGKSTAMQSLLLLGQSLYDNKNLKDLLVNGLFCELGLFEDLINVESDSKEIHIGLETDRTDEPKRVRFSYKEKSDRKGSVSGLIVDGKNYFETSGELGGGDAASKTMSLSNYPVVINTLFQNFVYVSADRLGPTAFEVKRDLYDNNPIGNNGAFRLNVLAGNESLKNRLADAISYVMDGGRIELKGDGEEGKSRDILKLFVSTLVSGKSIKSINCGFGYSYIIPILLAALTMKDGYLFIENPEAHLHPRAQSLLTKKLIEIALENNIQLFIETHSEHVVNAVRLCTLYDGPYKDFSNKDISLYFFDKNLEVIKLKMCVDAQIENWPLGFFDQAERDVAEILRISLSR